MKDAGFTPLEITSQPASRYNGSETKSSDYLDSKGCLRPPKGGLSQAGFTLVELITVIIIVAILAALALPQYTRVFERGVASRARSSLDSIRKAEGLYFALWSTYTTSLTNLDNEVPGILRVQTDDNWTYGVTTATTAVFTALAKRTRGSYAGSNIWINNDGQVDGNHPAIGGMW